MSFLIIDNAALKIAKVTHSLEQAEHWAELVVPAPNDYSIRGSEARDFSPYNHAELTAIYGNSFDRRLSDATPYNHTIREIREKVKDLEVDSTPVEEIQKLLLARFGRSSPAGWVAPDPSAFKQTKSRAAPMAKREKSGPATRPKAGTQTGRVWEIGDAIKEAHPDLSGKPLRAKIIEAAIAEGINQGTAQVQTGKWLKTQSPAT